MGFKTWRTTYKFHIQSATLGVIVLGSFAIYWALTSGFDGIAWIFYALVVLGFAVTMTVS